jgi:hypothetical protein
LTPRPPGRGAQPPANPPVHGRIGAQGDEQRAGGAREVGIQAARRRREGAQRQRRYPLGSAGAGRAQAPRWLSTLRHNEEAMPVRLGGHLLP